MTTENQQLREALQGMLHRFGAGFIDREEQPKTFGCHHMAETCTACAGLVSGWKAVKAAQAALTQRPAAQAGEVDIKSRVSELIAEHGTLRAAARSLNIDVGYLSRLEHGDKVHPSSETLAKIGLRDAGVKYQRLVFLPTQPAARQALMECPFCGSEPHDAHHIEYGRWAVTCRCGATGASANTGPNATDAAKIKAYSDAHTAWNTRASLPAPQQATPEPRKDEARRLIDTFRNDARGGRAATVHDLDDAANLIEASLSATPEPVQPRTFDDRNAKFREQNWQIRFDAVVDARRLEQEQLYSERERHTAEVKRLQLEIGRLTVAPEPVGVPVGTVECYQIQGEDVVLGYLPRPLPVGTKLYTRPVPVETEPEWIVNDLGELGVRVGSRFFFLYKGDSIEYGVDGIGESAGGVALHDDGTPMRYRIVGKREFGETCWPLSWVLRGHRYDRYTEKLVYTPGLSFGSSDDGEWRDLPALAAAQAKGVDPT